MICAANRVYNLDFRPAIAQHQSTGASATLLYKKVARGEDATGLFLTMNASGKVMGIKNSAEGEANVFLDSILIQRKVILDFVDCYKNLDYVDMMDILAANLGQLQVDSWQFTGYEHAVDHAQDYLNVSRDLLLPEIQEQLFPEDRPIYTKTQDSPPAKYLPGASVRNSILAASCILSGTVEKSILFRGVTIGAGAIVRNCVLMQNVTIEQLFNLLNERQNSGLSTVISTNLDLAKLRERYTERIASRITDTRRCMVMTLKGKDIRTGGNPV